ncbi:DUF1015 domain-containing protein, partial [bacterium]
KIADEALEREIADREPDFTAKDWFGNEHRLWAITDTATIETVQSALADKTLFIADGHHRYETAVNYWKECESKGLKPEPGATETYRNRMMTFINMDDPGLVVLPTHRVVHSVKNFDLDRFISAAEKNFKVERYAESKFQEVMAKMAMLGEQGEHTFVFVPKNAKEYYLLTLRDESIMDSRITEQVSAEWKRLDVTILHKLLLEDLLGIDAKALEEKRNLYYIRNKEDGFKYLEKDPDVQCVFYVNPTKVEQVKKIASAGERMPQKSTDFYPKLLTGMVINKLRFSE